LLAIPKRSGLDCAEKTYSVDCCKIFVSLDFFADFLCQDKKLGGLGCNPKKENNSQFNGKCLVVKETNEYNELKSTSGLGRSPMKEKYQSYCHFLFEQMQVDKNISKAYLTA
jgi:hypothetical protein